MLIIKIYHKFFPINYILHNSQTTKITNTEIKNYNWCKKKYKYRTLGAQDVLKINKEIKILKTKYSWKNFCYLIGWEEYNIDRICTLFLIFALFG